MGAVYTLGGRLSHRFYFYFNVATGMIAMLRTALISVTCVSVLMSLFTFIAGIVCYHYISQRWRASSADINKQPGSHSNPKDTESELELKENVAYITLRPAA